MFECEKEIICMLVLVFVCVCLYICSLITNCSWGLRLKQGRYITLSWKIFGSCHIIEQGGWKFYCICG